MTKYNINDNISTAGSQVTLTAYMIGEHPEKNQNGSLNPPPNTAQNRIGTKIRQICRPKLFAKRIPILKWLPAYDTNAAILDFIAGISVGLTVIPQAIAYSNVAGLPPQIGLYAAFLGCFVYTIFGSCKEGPIGPTAISALLTRENIHQFGAPGAVLLCFLTGCVQFIMGLLQLGFLIDFISGPVSIGFTSAIAIIIATTQVKDILGLAHPGSNFLQVWGQIFTYIEETRQGDCILGLCCIGILIILRTIKTIKVGPTDAKSRKLIHNLTINFIWLLSTGRNIIVVIVSALVAYTFELHDSKPFILTGELRSGLPAFQVPPFSIKVDNTTFSFAEITSSFGSGLVIVPLLGILESIALAKVFANGKTVDATQEMLALGACNIATSFVQGMPCSGALSRGAVNYSTGVKTTFGGVYTGLIVILALQWFTPYCSYIPKASLAAVIIAAVVFMVELHVVKPIWRTKKSDLIPACATFVGCLFLRLEIGIAIGVGINLVFLLYATARPSVEVQKIEQYPGVEYLLITPDRSLTFPSVEYVRYIISKVGVKQGLSSRPVVIDAKHIQGADFTAARGIKSLIEDFSQRNQPIFFFNLKQSVINTFEGVQPKHFVYCKTLMELDELLKQYSSRLRPTHTLILEGNLHMNPTL